MHTKYYIFTLIALPFLSIAQTTDLPVMEPFFSFEEWSYDQYNVMPIEILREDGQLYIKYIGENDSLLRMEYYKIGGLKSECEIIQTLVTDKTVVSEYDTQEFKSTTFKTWIDWPFGRYVEYYESWHEQTVKIEGQFENGRKIGEWVFYDTRGNKAIANYNEEGDLDGPYKEFYYSQDGTYVLKLEGQYGINTFFIYTSNKYSKKAGKNNIKESRRTGIWKYYSKDGFLLETSEYKWIGN